MKLHEECGIFACIVKNNNAFEHIKYGLSLLQHRGQEGAGITCGYSSYKTFKNIGLVSEVFKNVLQMEGDFGIGHVQYSTDKKATINHIQPFCFEDIALCYNGTIKNVCDKLFEIKKSPTFWTSEDITKILLKYFSESAFSIVLALPKKIIGIKDPNGYRPLMFCIAEEGYFLASEDCAFDSLNIEKIIEIKNGEYIEITKDGYNIQPYFNNSNSKQCVFEHIYFANPASEIFSKNVYKTRVELGHIMAQNDNIEADIVVPVMSSGLAAAIGYSEYSKIPMHLGIKKTKAIRSFIQPDDKKRKVTAQEKYIPIKSVVENKRIILVDDSIVRGTTMKHLVVLLKKSGAKEIHIRLSSPAIVNTCCWGVDIPNKEELIYPKFNSETKLAEYLGADSVKFISIENLKNVFEQDKWCYNCFINR